jgi:SHS2 domain-containing protein
MKTIVATLASIGFALSAIAQPTTPAPTQSASEPAKEVAFTFDTGEKCAPGKVPTDWKAEGTNQKGPVATWEVTADPTAPSGPNVLALTTTNHDSDGTFNICWTDKTRFKDGEIEVKFKAVSGKEDQGGGLIWRVKDKDNYMIARYNPLEENFRLYYVKDGSRKQIESAKATIKAGEWHTMKIEHEGDSIECYLDGKKYIDVRDDHIKDEGGIGVWTKADAVTSFDDLKVEFEDQHDNDDDDKDDDDQDEPKK